MQQSFIQYKRSVLALAAIFLVFLSVATPVFSPKEAKAEYHQVYIQTTVDVDNWEILAGVVNETMSYVGEPLEHQRIGSDTLKNLAATSAPKDAASYVDNSPASNGVDSSEYLVLNFPGDSMANKVFTHISSGNDDMERATIIRNSLIYDLNGAFRFVYGDDWMPSGGTREERFNSYKSAMKSFLSATPGGSCNGASFSTCVESDFSSTKREYPDSTVYYTDYVKITKGGETRIFLYRMPKGYLRSGLSGRDFSNLRISELNGSKDTEFIHWGTLAVEAVINYQCDEKIQVTSDSVYDSTPSALEQAMGWVFSGIADWIAGALGLWSFDELVFNSGARGTATYVGGIFPSSWQPFIWAFFFIMEIVAMCILIFGLIFNVARKALSTVNPVSRASAIEQIKFLFIVAIALGLLPVALQVFIGVTENLTGLFADALGTKNAAERFRNLANSSGSIGSALAYLIYLGSLIYLNIFYVTRAFMVSFLIMFAPIFVVNLAVSENRRRLTLSWANELAANLLIQPLQAMAFCFILMTPSTGRKIESLIIAYILIPVTAMLRGLFFGNGGGLIDQISNRGKAAAGKLGMLGAGIAAGAFAGGVGGFMNARHGDGGNGGGREGGGPSDSNQPDSSGKSGSTETPSSTTAGVKSQAKGPASDTSSPQAGTAAASSAESTNGASSGASVNAFDVDGSSNSHTASAPQQGTNTGSTQISDAVKNSSVAGGGGGAVGSQPTANASLFKAGAWTAGAVALSVLGGAQDTFNRRVFGLNSRGGGFVTQLSRSAANKAFQQNQTNAAARAAEAAKRPELVSEDGGSKYNEWNPNSWSKGEVVGEGSDMEFRAKGSDVGMTMNEGTLRMDFAKMGVGDIRRAMENYDLLNDPTMQPEAKQHLMDSLGYHAMPKLKRDMAGNVTGMEVDIDESRFSTFSGLEFGKDGGVSLTGPAVQFDGQGGLEPRMVQDGATIMNSYYAEETKTDSAKAAREFDQEVRAAGGSVEQGEDGMSRDISMPKEAFESLSEQYTGLKSVPYAVEDDGTVSMQLPANQLREITQPLWQPAVPQSLEGINTQRAEARDYIAAHTPDLERSAPASPSFTPPLPAPAITRANAVDGPPAAGPAAPLDVSYEENQMTLFSDDSSEASLSDPVGGPDAAEIPIPKEPFAPETAPGPRPGPKPAAPPKTASPSSAEIPGPVLEEVASTSQQPPFIFEPQNEVAPSPPASQTHGKKDSTYDEDASADESGKPEAAGRRNPGMSNRKPLSQNQEA